MEMIIALVGIVIGYVGAIYTWDRVKLAINGAGLELAALKAKVAEYEAKVRAAL